MSNTTIEQRRVLIVDHDEHILMLLTGIFSKQGYSVQCAENGKEAIASAKKFAPHLILLDVVLPGMDGIETCHELRQVPTLKNTIIAFYTSRSEDYSQIAAFGAGADDYIIKPVKPPVLASRVQALFRRQRTAGKPAQVGNGAIRLDRERYLVIKGSNTIVLPRKEFELLALLLATPRKVYTRPEIYREIWGGEFGSKNRTIDVHIRKLREKIGEEFIKTIKGVGYCFETN